MNIWSSRKNNLGLDSTPRPSFPAVRKGHRLRSSRSRLKTMPNNELPKKKLTVKLPDLPPRKDPKGGGLSYLRRPSLPIPPPGFFSSSGKETADQSG